MGYQKVLVDAWVFDGPSGAHPDQGLPQPPLGIWGPTDPRPQPPIYMPPQQPSPPLGIWGGAPIPTPTPPIYYPEQPPLGIWGPTDPRPSHPIAPGGPPPTIWPGPGIPTHPIAPGGQPPQIWGPTDPRPTPPIHMPGQPPGFWGPTDPRPSQPISGIPGLPGYEPPAGFPILDPDEIPDHADVPDLNAGQWVYVSEEENLIPAFVPWPLAVNPLSHNPMYPPEEEQPGEWVVIYLATANFNGLANAWIPQSHVTAEPAPPTAEQLPA